MTIEQWKLYQSNLDRKKKQVKKEKERLQTAMKSAKQGMQQCRPVRLALQVVLPIGLVSLSWPQVFPTIPTEKKTMIVIKTLVEMMVMPHPWKPSLLARNGAKSGKDSNLPQLR
jgi:hypothetical protein